MASQQARPYRAKALRSTAAVLVVAAAVVAGAGLSRVVWPTGQSTSSAAPGGASGGSGSAGNSSGSSGSQSPYVTTPGYNPFGGGSGSSGPSSAGSGSGEGAGAPSDVAAIAAKIDPAVVDINVIFNYAGAEGAGTGIVLTPNGEILTNNHVIDEATKISVTDVGNGKTYSATVVGYDNADDVAVLQLQGASGLTTAKLATSAPSVGEAVVAIGNAGGAGGTPTSAGGSVTALGQSITASDELTQTDEQLSGLVEVNANIESGDSGGPLVNAAGEVIGMDTAASSSFAFSAEGNQGFAIPISKALSIARAVESGHSTSSIHIGGTAFLGVLLTSPSSSTGPLFGTGSGSTVGGVEVGRVVGGAPAQKAGITGGDVITSLNGERISSEKQVTHILAAYHPGDKVQIGWVDASGQAHSATVTLASGPPA
jgi:S1-C subfamily serine protease